MDLHELHQRTRIDKRRLRYCLDHDLIPGLNIEIAADEAGRPRKFHSDVGFAIVCAAKLVELGLPHKTIRVFMRGLAEARAVIHRREQPALSALYGRQVERARAYLGDSLNVRVVFEDPVHRDLGWFAPGNPARLDSEYRPVVEVALDLGQIRDQVF